jgi:hypothetical protein
MRCGTDTISFAVPFCVALRLCASLGMIVSPRYMLANAPHLLACCAAVVTIKLLVVVTGTQQHLQHLIRLHLNKRTCATTLQALCLYGCCKA